MSQRNDIKRTLQHKWPPKRASWLRSDAVKQFLNSYRNYRLGDWKGAKGEIISIQESEASDKNALDSDTTNNDIFRLTETRIFQDTEDPKMIQQLNKLENWRSAYRQFRLGRHKGAHGELTSNADTFSSEELRLLPVAALAQCLADMIRKEKKIHPPNATFHVHFGAGKLGLGLVLPAIVASNCPFALLQRPSAVWNKIVESSEKYVDVIVNDEKLTTLYVIRSEEDFDDLISTTPTDTPSASIESMLSAIKAEDNVINGVLVLDPRLDGIFIKAADAFSCSLGPGLRSTLKKIPKHLSPHSGLFRPALYACENDIQAVEAIKGLMEHAIWIKTCMVDRICSERIIESKQIKVLCEPYKGEIIVTADCPNAIQPGLAGPNVRLPTMSGAYSYLYNRKFLLVNGTHTTLAFMTLRDLCQDSADAPGDFELYTYETLNEQCRKELLAWAVARCLVLLHNHDVTVIKRVHNIESDVQVIENLWDYAQTTIHRFSTVRDSTKRVLGGGVENRYKTRLKAILDTLSMFQNIELQSKMLKIAGIRSMDELIRILSKLVVDCVRFVNLDMVKGDGQELSLRIIDEYQRQFTKTH